MADLIDRDALMIDLQSDCPETDVCISGWPCNDFIVNRQPAVNRWISVEDALPEIDKDVIVYAVRKDSLGDAVTTITQYINHIWFGHRIDTEPYWKDPWQYFHSDYEITHWMPLPEPPESEVQ